MVGQTVCENAADATWHATNALDGSLIVEGGASVRKDVTCSGAYLYATTESGAITSGALVVDGGVGVAKSLNVGHSATVAGVTSCLDTTQATWSASAPLTGALLVQGGLSVRNNVVSETASFRGGVAATSTTSGTLVVNGGIGVDGNVYCNNTFNMSDQRLKTKIETIPDALDKVCGMRGCTFEWNDRMPGLTGTASAGVIAQEVRQQAPLCVAHNPETDLYAVGPMRYHSR